MVVNNLNLFRVPVAPNEAYAPLVVDSDAVLPAAVACQSLKPIAWWRTQVIKADRSVQVAQFPAPVTSRSGGKPFGSRPLATAAVRLSLNDIIICDT